MAIEKFPTAFQQESLAAINRLFPVSYSIFALIDPGIRSKGVALRNLGIEADQAYVAHYGRYDPLYVRHFEDSRDTVVCLDSLLTEKEIYRSVYYREFMRPNRMRYVVDVFLRRGGKIFGFISLIRSQSMDNFSAEESALLRILQPLLELSLNNIYPPPPSPERSVLAARYQLTDRELDVIDQIIAGSPNKDIADDLFLSLSTVKTHLQHIFEKTAVASRTQLLAKIFQTL